MSEDYQQYKGYFKQTSVLCVETFEKLLAKVVI